jgi:2-oxoglutarate ferredoxin oxidoreductase subunit beta
MVEILSQCPTGWSMEPEAASDWLDKNMIPVFPLGEIKKSSEASSMPVTAKLDETAKQGAA